MTGTCTALQSIATQLLVTISWIQGLSYCVAFQSWVLTEATPSFAGESPSVRVELSIPLRRSPSVEGGFGDRIQKSVYKVSWLYFCMRCAVQVLKYASEVNKPHMRASGSDGCLSQGGPCKDAYGGGDGVMSMFSSHAPFCEQPHASCALRLAWH